MVSSFWVWCQSYFTSSRRPIGGLSRSPPLYSCMVKPCFLISKIKKRGCRWVGAWCSLHICWACRSNDAYWSLQLKQVLGHALAAVHVIIDLFLFIRDNKYILQLNQKQKNNTKKQRNQTVITYQEMESVAMSRCMKIAIELSTWGKSFWKESSRWK